MEDPQEVSVEAMVVFGYQMGLKTRCLLFGYLLCAEIGHNVGRVEALLALPVLILIQRHTGQPLLRGGNGEQRVDSTDHGARPPERGI